MKVTTVIQFLVWHVQGAAISTIANYPTWLNKYTAYNTASNTCVGCIRSGYNWIFDNNLPGWWRTTDSSNGQSAYATMGCCPSGSLKNANCPKYKDGGNNIISGRYASENLDPDMSIAACPQSTGMCGAQQNTVKFATKDDPHVTISFSTT